MGFCTRIQSDDYLQKVEDYESNTLILLEFVSEDVKTKAHCRSFYFQTFNECFNLILD